MTIQTDALIIGAGPCGLFQVFELGLLNIHAHIVDSLPQPGGQCAELYPEKPIYDIPALPVVGAQELIDRLMQQIKPFDPQFHLGQQVTELQPQEDGRFRVKTSTGTGFDAGSVIIAAGLGAFSPRQLKAPGAAEFIDTSIHNKVIDPTRLHGQKLAILGGGDSALDWALALCEQAASLALIHRREDFRAQPASVSKMQELVAADKMSLHVGNVINVLSSDGRLHGLELINRGGEKSRVECDQVLVFWGLAPNLGPIADWHLELDKRALQVDTEKFQTSIPGIFAVGDINTYPGKKKLILSGFHEAALAAFGVQQHLHPEQKVRLQYTTTSPIMHERLGVA
ncbi:MAG: NAD(P)/FAD-dependent oxidoreductase [Gammaproteobacteria bacterium]|nr:NAD(P)/FAD-dependent oxidoreductase [Gammaproteobacteria bacterium]